MSEDYEKARDRACLQAQQKEPVLLGPDIWKDGADWGRAYESPASSEARRLLRAMSVDGRVPEFLRRHCREVYESIDSERSSQAETDGT